MNLIEILDQHPELEYAYLLGCQKTLDETAKETNVAIHDHAQNSNPDDEMLLMLMEEIYYLDDARYKLEKRLTIYHN